MVADVTVTRLADDRFRVVTGAGYLASEMAWLRAHVEDDDGAITIRDVSGDLATIGLWGPRARDVLVAAGAPADEVGNDAIPMRRAGPSDVGPAPVHAARISYAGELGWELTRRAEWAVHRLGSPSSRRRGVGLEPIGYRALDALRMEKGYRYFGTDLTMLDTPVRGRSRCLRPARPRVRSSGARRSPTAHATGSDRRLRTLLIGGADYEPIYGGEAVRFDGEVVGRLRSVAYGPTVERTIGYAYLSATLANGTGLEIDVFDRRVVAVIAPDVVVDPHGDRMRG